jgi:STE24 endopeptidase
MNNFIFYLIIIIPVSGFLVERYLDYLNSRMWSDTLPEKLKGICDNEAYKKTQLYERENKRLSFWSSTFNLAIILSMILLGGFALIDNLARELSSNLIIIALLFFAIIGFASDLINVPFSFYDNFVIEKKFGFNTMTTSNHGSLPSLSELRFLD